MKRKLLVAALVASIVSFGFAQDVDLSVVHKIKKEGLQNSKVMETAFYLTDVSGPRLSGSTNLKNANEWSKKQLEEWGLANANVEKWGDFGRGWDIEKSYVAMTAPYYAPLIASPKAWTPGTNGLVKGDLVYLDASNDEELEKYKGKLNGKVVMRKFDIEQETSFEPAATRLTEEELASRAKMPMGGGRGGWSAERRAQYMAQRAFNNKLNTFLISEGVAAIITGRRGTEGTYFTSNGASYAVDADEVLPEFEMQTEHAARMARLMDAGIPVAVELEVKTKFLSEDISGYNVVAEIPGTDKTLKDEIVMLGGHIDSWHAGTGATDNAAGVAVMMEAIRILNAIGVKPKRTIRIALWGNEEQGIYGSRNYVKNHFGDTETGMLKADHEKFQAYFNIDNGTGRVRGIYTQGNDAAKPIFEQWFTPFEDMIENTTITNRNTGGTDHLGFDAVGLPGFQFIQDPIEYGTRTHHTNMDTYERLQEADLKQMAVVVASFVYNASQMNGKFPRKPLPSQFNPAPSAEVKKGRR